MGLKAGDVNLKLTADIADLQAKLAAAGGGVDGFADRTGAAAKDVQQHADRMAAALDGTKTSVYGTVEALQRLERMGVGAGASMSAGTGAAAQQVQVQAAKISAAVSGVANANQVSAVQTAAAWRQLPMQLQDVAVSLQGGMNPLTVLMQQGPQITSSFGGVRATMVALGGAISPVAAGAAALGVAFAAAGAAAYQGAREIDELQTALVNSGNQIGMTAGSLATMAGRLDDVAGVTRGQAVEALALLAGKTGIARDGIEQIAAAAMGLERVGGPAVAETAKQFAELGKAPLAASLKLNEQYGYLTESVYRQVKALEDEGRTVEAAKVAQEAYAQAVTSRLPELEKNLGTLQRAWLSVSGAAREAWDAMKSAGRADTAEERIVALNNQINAIQAAPTAGIPESRLYLRRNALAALVAERDALQETMRLERRSAEQKAQQLATTKALATWDQQGAQYLTNQAKAAREVAQARQLGAQAGASQAEIEARVAAIQEKYAEKRKSTGDPYQAQRDAAKEWASAIERLQTIQADAEGDAQGYSKAQQEALSIFASPAFLRAPDSWKAATVAQIEAAIAAEQQAAAQKKSADAAKDAQKAYDDLVAAFARSAQGAEDQVSKLQIEEEAAALVVRTNVSLAMAIEQVSIARLREEQARQMSFGDDAAVAALQREIDARSRLLDLMGRKEARGAGEKDSKEADRRLEAYLGKDIGTDFAAGFDTASQSLGVFVQQLGNAVELQTKYQQALQDAGGDSAKIAAVQAKNAKAQLTTYAAMAGAAKGFFKEGSKGYKTMEVAEKTFRAFELGQAIANAAQQLGLIETVTAATVAGNQTAAASSVTAATTDAAASQLAGTAAASAAVAGQAAKGDPYTAWARMAAMIAAMAALGFMVGGSGGGGGSKSTYVAGSGTTLGDRSAASTSIADSLERLTAVDTMSMQYSAQMASSLKNIENSMAGVGTRVVHLDSEARKNWFYARRERVHVANDSIGDVLAGRLRVSDEASNSLALGKGQVSWEQLRKDPFAVRSSLTEGIQQVFVDYVDMLKSSARSLGSYSTKFTGALNDYNLQVGTIDLNNLSSDEIEERLAAVFSAEGDKMATALLPGFERFWGLGEGYLETVVRVASGSEEAKAALGRLHVTMIGLTEVTDRYGDVGAALVRESLVRAEQRNVTVMGMPQVQLTGIGQIIDSMRDSNATEIEDTYEDLLDLRSAFRSVGLSAAAITQPLLQGAGSLDDLQSGWETYTSEILGPSEMLKIQAARFAEQLSLIGIKTVPRTNEEFRKLVEGIDTGTEAGQLLLGQVLGLAEGYSDLASAQKAIADERQGLEQQLWDALGDTASQRAYELSQLDDSNRALQQRIWALQDEQERLTALANAGKSISTLIEELHGGTSSSASLAQRRAAYTRELSAAQGGDITASESIAATARSLIDALKSSATDPLQLALETARISAQLQALPAVAAMEQQAASDAAAALEAAAQSSLSASAAAAAASASTTTSSTATTPSAITELEALRTAVADLTAEVRSLRSGQESGLASIAANTGRAARLLDDMTYDGQALSVRLTS